MIYLAKLPRLAALDLSYTDVTAAGLAQLADFPALGHLMLDPSQISDEAILALKGMPHLRQLSINGDFGLWGKRYRSAGTIDVFFAQLQADLPGIEVSAKDSKAWFMGHGLNGTLAEPADGSGKAVDRPQS